MSALVLLVEDDPTLKNLLGLMLRGAGYQVIEADDGLEALARAEGQEIDLLLTDLVMPNLDGVALARRLLAERPALQVLLMSGREPGAGLDLPFMPKPLNASGLLRRVRELLSRSREDAQGNALSPAVTPEAPDGAATSATACVARLAPGSQWGVPSPGGEPMELEKNVDALVSRLEGLMAALSPSAPAWAPVLSALEEPGGLVLSMDLPGVRRDSLEVRVQGDVLEVRGERRPVQPPGSKSTWSECRAGPFYRRVTLPPGQGTSELQAELRDGVLEVRIPLSRVQRVVEVR